MYVIFKIDQYKVRSCVKMDILNIILLFFVAIYIIMEFFID